MWKWFRALRARAQDDERSLPYVDPLKAGRHPFQTYLLAMCVLSGIPYLFGYASAEAVEKQLPEAIALSWGLVLLLGSTMALVATYWWGSLVNALTMERIGLNLTGGSALVYALCIVGARSGIAPLLLLVLATGYGLLRIPIIASSEKRENIISDLLTVAGLGLIVGSMGALTMTPAREILVGAFVILGFGFSCLRRARDIGQIFHRANEIDPTTVLREGEGTDEE